MSVEVNDVALLTAIASVGRVAALLRRRSVRVYVSRVPPSVVALVVSLVVIANSA